MITKPAIDNVMIFLLFIYSHSLSPVFGTESRVLELPVLALVSLALYAGLFEYELVVDVSRSDVDAVLLLELLPLELLLLELLLEVVVVTVIVLPDPLLDEFFL